MLRVSLYASVFLAVSSVAMSQAVFAAGPHHHQGPAMQPRAAAVPGSVTTRSPRVARPAVHRPMGPLRAASPVGPNAIFSPLPGPVFFNGAYGERQTLPLEPAASTHTINLNINPIPVVLGIRRAPEAAPLIYRIEPGSVRHHGAAHRSIGHGRRSAPDAKVLSLGEPHAARHQRHGRGDHQGAGVERRDPADTTTPRIIVVRAR